MKLVRNSIQTKLTVIILSIITVALCTLGGINYWEAHRIISASLSHDMENVAKSSAGEVHDWLTARKNELIITAMDPVIVSGNKEAMVPYLSSVVKSMQGMDGAAYAAADGSFIGSSGMTGNVATAEYFTQGMQGHTVITNPRISPVKGNYVTVVAVPVKSGDRVTGILFATVDMEGLSKKVTSTKIGKSGYAYVVQGDGTVIIHPDKNIILKLNTLTDTTISPALRKITEEMVNGANGIVQYKYSDRERIVAYYPIEGVKWSLAVTAPIEEITDSLSKLLVTTIITILAVLAVTALLIAWYARRFVKPILLLETAANRIAGGDISLEQLDIHSNDEIGRLARSFELMSHNLYTLVKKILGATEQVAASAEELNASSEQSAQAANAITTAITQIAEGSNEQMGAAEYTRTVIVEMTDSLQQLTSRADQAASHSDQAAEQAQAGDKVVEKVALQMRQIEETVISSAQVVSKLGERSKEIGQIVDTISGIAGQTNLLALNAAIEAARAGEQGRGFAVVAEEVRKLAEQSQDAAKKIAELIGEIQGDTEKAVVAMDNGTREVKIGAEVVNTAGVTFQKIVELVDAVSKQVKEISAAMQQLFAGSQEIVLSIQKVDSLGKESAGEAQGVSAASEEQLASMEEIASSSQALAVLAQDLQSAVNSFRI
ncbi:methyl-accepting chemotaxis protein [Sporomusa sp.]|uniref:methyl-accepting chemotaxis protein n=1 Tax=Sporomusa sp. TaxID=2078658 RepID=UPI002C2CA9F4|nr:methyl-accepting chemotaxis protein [Sporomusa sp.]HWR06973.1 methyl-accepting chemotaxis protein [Sporomusa sp.]